MSKKTTYAKNAKKNKVKKNTELAIEEKEAKEDSKPYVNPANTPWGKIIIFTLAILMAGGGIFSIIWALINR